MEKSTMECHYSIIFMLIVHHDNFMYTPMMMQTMPQRHELVTISFDCHSAFYFLVQLLEPRERTRHAVDDDDDKKKRN